MKKKDSRSVFTFMAVTVMVQEECSVDWKNCGLRLIPIAVVNSFKYGSFKVIESIKNMPNGLSFVEKVIDHLDLGHDLLRKLY